MILAAAVKFLITSTGQEAVLCGARHSDVFAQLEPLGFGPHQGYKELEQGFVDHHGRFLGRKEAFTHAKECGQLSTRIIHEREAGGICGGTELISEDLW